MPAEALTQQNDPASSCRLWEALRTRRLALIANLASSLKLIYRLSMQYDDERLHAVVESLSERIAAMAGEMPRDPPQIESELETAERALAVADALLEDFQSEGGARPTERVI